MEIVENYRDFCGYPAKGNATVPRATMGGPDQQSKLETVVLYQYSHVVILVATTYQYRYRAAEAACLGGVLPRSKDAAASKADGWF